jgi:hypothetical protein
MPRYAELQVTTNFSFLRGASHGEELVAQAKALGLEALAVTDRNTLAGVVRAHVAAKEVGLKLIVGARLDLQDGPSLLCLPRDRAAYGLLSRLLSLGQMRAKKGECTLFLEDVAAHAEGQIFIALAPEAWDWREVQAASTDAEPLPTAEIIPFALRAAGKREAVSCCVPSPFGQRPPVFPPSPLMGEGWGGGGAQTSEVVHTPHPVPPPQGGRERK